ncbi:hypothetical protein, partial [Pseudescherichia sp.]|uniref:hypothetical protein n=1 Tax=Pseudescherichia sp. TaxID=2055881 RepID=UPI0028A62FC2
FSLRYLLTCLNHRGCFHPTSAKQTFALANKHAVFPAILRIDKTKHGAASYLQFISDAKDTRRKLSAVA